MKKLGYFFLLLAFLSALAFLFVGCTPPPKLSTSSAPINGGTISPSTGNFTRGSNVVLVASPAQYYKFVGWAGDASGNTNPLTVIMNSNKQIVAQFSKIMPTIQVKCNPVDGGTVRPDSGTYEAGNRVNFTATPANKYRFIKWGTDASGNTNPLNILVDKDMIITAIFVPQYTLAVTTNPTSGTISPMNGIYDAGTQVNLTATPLFPYAFKNWVGTDNNNINPTIITMNADKSLSVTFDKLTKKTQTPVEKSGNTYGIASIPIDLNQSEWIEVTIDCDTALPPQDVYIQGPDGQTIKDFGSTAHAVFQLQAQVAGALNVVIKANSISTWGTNYNVTYTAYGK